MNVFKHVVLFEFQHRPRVGEHDAPPAVRDPTAEKQVEKNETVRQQKFNLNRKTRLVLDYLKLTGNTVPSTPVRLQSYPARNATGSRANNSIPCHNRGRIRRGPIPPDCHHF